MNTPHLSDFRENVLYHIPKSVWAVEMIQCIFTEININKGDIHARVISGYIKVFNIYKNVLASFPKRKELCYFVNLFGGRCLDADPLYINELDTINSLLQYKKYVRGSSDIRFVAFYLCITNVQN